MPAGVDAIGDRGGDGIDAPLQRWLALYFRAHAGAPISIGNSVKRWSSLGPLQRQRPPAPETDGWRSARSARHKRKLCVSTTIGWAVSDLLDSMGAVPNASGRAAGL